MWADLSRPRGLPAVPGICGVCDVSKALVPVFPRMHPVEVWAGHHGRRGDERGGAGAQEVNAALL